MAFSPLETENTAQRTCCANYAPTALPGHRFDQTGPSDSFEPIRSMGILRKVQKLSPTSEHEGLFLPSNIAPTSMDAPEAPARPRQTSWADVPWRTIIATVGIVVVTYGLLLLLDAAARIITWVAIAGFMAIVLAPLVSRLDRRLGRRPTAARPPAGGAAPARPQAGGGPPPPRAGGGRLPFVGGWAPPPPTPPPPPPPG